MSMMRAMVFENQGESLKRREISIPIPSQDQFLIRVQACGICRTDLHILDGELPHPKLPLIPGHQIIGTIVASGGGRSDWIGKRVGVPWLGGSCGTCPFCLKREENLCTHAIYTGYQINGGFAEYCTANQAFCFPIPSGYPSVQAAPLMCAGVIGYRCLRFAGEGKRLGLYGFGAAAHILTQVARYQGRDVYAFTREGDQSTQKFAKDLGAVWAGGSDQRPPAALDAAIIFAPEGKLVPLALRAVQKAGTVVCGGIHMSDIPSFPYADLWEERVIRSVANLTRKDAQEFLELAPKVPVETVVTVYPLEEANQALEDLRNGNFKGAAVIQVGNVDA